MFKTLLLTALLPCLSGGTIQNQPSYLSKNSENDEITLTAQESSKELLTFYEDFLSGNYEYVSLSYDNVNYVYDDSTGSQIIYIGDTTSISFVLNYEDFSSFDVLTFNYLFIYYDGDNYSYLTSDLVLLFNFNEPAITEQVFNTAYEALQEDLQPPYTNILQEIVSILVGGITGIATGLGNGVSQLVSSIFISEGNLSVFGGVIVVFAGLGLAVGLSRWVMNFLTSLGKKD